MNYPSSDAPYPLLKIQSRSLAHNLDALKRLAPRSKILIPVKANAYGCGLSTLFPFFDSHHVDFLGVANCHEAEHLRYLGWQKPIINLGGFFPENAECIVKNSIIASITDLWQFESLEKTCERLNRSAEVHLKLDLGMGRIGLLREQLADMVSEFKKCQRLKISGIFTHFPFSSEENRAETLGQNTEFKETALRLIAQMQLQRDAVLLHAANSYASIFFPDTHHDMIRPGIIFYGYYQSEADRIRYNGHFQFQSSLELEALPISIRKLRKHTTISYGALYQVQADEESVGVLPLGYADGIPRALSNQIDFAGHPLRGRVTMDQIIVGNVTEPKPVLLLGEGAPSLEHWGELANSFSYEIMSHLGNRLRRVLG